MQSGRKSPLTPGSALPPSTLGEWPVIPELTRRPMSPVALHELSQAGFPCPYCGARPDLDCDHRERIAAKPRPRLEGDDRPVRADQRATGVNHHRREFAA